MARKKRDRSRSRRRGRWALRVGLAVLVGLVVYVTVTFIQVVVAGHADDTDRSDAIVVLGAAQYDGRPSPVLRERLDHARQLYEDGVAPRILLTGGKRSGDRFTEAYAGYRYLVAQGVPREDLLVVSDGSSTWDSLRAAERVLRREGAGRVTLVSNSYHALRLRGIAGEIGVDAGVSPTGAAPSMPELLRETGLVAVGRLVGFGRMLRLAG